LLKYLVQMNNAVSQDYNDLGHGMGKNNKKSFPTVNGVSYIVLFYDDMKKSDKYDNGLLVTSQK